METALGLARVVPRDPTMPLIFHMYMERYLQRLRPIGDGVVSYFADAVA